MVFLFAILLLMAAVLYYGRYFRQRDNLTAEVLCDGVLIRKIELRKEAAEEFAVVFKTGKNVIRVEKGKIAVISADCPDKDCVRRGWLKYRGDSAICLPNHLSIRIRGASEVDAVTF